MPPSSNPPRLRALAALLAVALGVALAPARAASELPDLGDVAQTVLTPSDERRLGGNAMREIRASGAYLNDPEVNAYLASLGRRLVAGSPEPRDAIEFFAVADNGINAFALPGGHIGVNTGLILTAQSESELAAVLAHEIAHVQQHHLARLLKAQREWQLPTLAAMAAAIVLARSNPDAVQASVATGQALAIQQQLNFTREHEIEADRIGFQILDRAGFDTRGMAAFLERMQRAFRLYETGAVSYLRTHPLTYERIAEAQDRAFHSPYRQLRDSSDFHYVRALLRSYVASPQEAVRYFDTALEERRFNDEQATRYGLVAALLRAKDFARARRELATLEAAAPAHPMIEALAGQVLMQSGALKEAVARYRGGLSRFPTHMQLVYDYPDALIKDGQAAAAVKFLEVQLQTWSSDVQLHQLAARAYGELGRRALQHRHLAEAYALGGNLGAAVGQLELAAKAGDGDFFQMSVIDSRLRQLRVELAEQQREQRALGRL